MRRFGAFLALAVVVAGSASRAAQPVRAAEPYTMATAATYDVQAEKRTIAVRIDVTFTNLTPNPSGAISVFEKVPLAVHDGAASATARDAKGPLKVALARQGDVNVATVTLRTAVGYKRQARFTLSYQLPDGRDPSVHVRPSVAIFPVWSFGTSSRVSVAIPASFEVRADGDALTATRDGTNSVLSSGPIPDPAHWLAIVSAQRETATTTATQTVALDGGTVDVQVRSWVGDEAWGRSTLALVVRALPALEREIGMPYDRAGPLVVSEAVSQGEPAGPLSEMDAGAQDVQVGFDQPPFTVIHQAAHLWFGVDRVSERWLREGLASHFGAAVAREQKVAAPYDPIARTKALHKDAFPLQEWKAGDSDARTAYGYAASWSFVDRLAAQVGNQTLRAALKRASAGVSAYDPAPAEAPAPTPSAAAPPLDARSLLDQLETLSGQDLAADFRDVVFDAPTVAQLSARRAARTAYAELLTQARDWGAPRRVVAALAEWRFDEAAPEMTAARSWLASRDELVQQIDAAGLSTPERLRDAYLADGGGSAARSELEAERVVVTDYAAALGRSTASRSLFQRVGLLGGPDPDALLASAHSLFADGELRGAADAASQATARLDGAESAGILRLASAVVLVVFALAAVLWLARRRRTLPEHGV